MNVVITIPAYNEQKTIGSVISGIKQVMDQHRYNYQVLVVDDGSRDATVKVARDAGAIVVSHPINYGLAETFRTEIKNCLKMDADVIVHIDADGQYLASDIPKLLKPISLGYDLVLGSRFKGKIESMPLLKRLGNIAFSKTISGITHLNVSDCQTGFRAFTRKVAESISLTSNHTYTQEQVIRAVRQKFRIAEVPVYFAKRPGKSKLIKNPFEYAFRAWINIMRIYRDYEPLKFFGLIGGLFILVGFLLGLWLVFLFLTTGVVGHMPSTILTMLLIVTGVQIVVFGFLADMNKK